MGKRDFRKHEPKKPKKAAKKPTSSIVLAPPVNVEVVRKKRKELEESEE